MTYIKNYGDFLNESEGRNTMSIITGLLKGSWEEILKGVEGMDGKDELGAVLQGILSNIKSKEIYDQKIPGYPFVLAMTGSGDEDGSDDAWLIKDEKDLFRWITTVDPSNKVFYSLKSCIEDEGYDLEDVLNGLSVQSETDDFSNGYRVDLFPDEKAMKKRIKDTIKCQECNGKGKVDGEECDSCDGTGEADQDHDERDYGLIDGDIFPDRKLQKTWK
jgi:hypothetical protein